MKLRYEIDENNVVTAWYDEENNKDLAFIQPNYPDGRVWNLEEATIWVEYTISNLESVSNKSYSEISVVENLTTEENSGNEESLYPDITTES